MAALNRVHPNRRDPPRPRATGTRSSYDSGHQTQNRNSWKHLALLYGIGGLGALCVGYSLFRGQGHLSFRFQPKWIFSPAQCAEEGNNRRSKHYNFLAEAVETAAPSVVYIEKSQPVSTIFGETMAVSSGSGFIVDESGYVLTCAHVVGNSRQVKVKLVSGRVIAGEVTDIDEVADLALVKFNIPTGEWVTALKFGSSADLRPGEWVVALGSPLSLSNTITAGIVSSVHRPSKELGLHHDKPDMQYIQTDAPVTVGNSGGPLVNLDGEVIGVNTMTAGPGISFAIPSDFAKNFVENANKSVSRKKTAEKYAIGISMLSITPGIRRSIQLRNLPSEVTHGVFLANVWQNSPAAQAGLQRGDVIVRINGGNVHTSDKVYEIVQTGKRLSMEIVRGSHWHTVVVQPEPLYSQR